MDVLMFLEVLVMRVVLFVSFCVFMMVWRKREGNGFVKEVKGMKVWNGRLGCGWGLVVVEGFDEGDVCDLVLIGELCVGVFDFECGVLGIDDFEIVDVVSVVVFLRKV